MNKWHKIIVHKSLLSTRYEKSTKVFFYKKSNYQGCHVYFPNKLIKDYQSGDYYKSISVCDGFEYRVYGKLEPFFILSSSEIINEFDRSNLKAMEKDIKSSYIEIIDPEPFFAKTVEVLDELINK